MMPTSIDLDSLTEADLRVLVDNGLRCGTDAAFAPAGFERPFLRELSSLANMSGGHLFVGIENNGGVSRFAPLTGNPEEECRRLEHLARKGIAPPVEGVRMKSVSLADGGFVIVVRVPRSRRPPYQISDPRDDRGSRPSAAHARDIGGAYRVHPHAISDGFFGVITVIQPYVPIQS